MEQDSLQGQNHPQAAVWGGHSGEQALQEALAQSRVLYQSEKLLELVDDQQQFHLGVVGQNALNRA